MPSGPPAASPSRAGQSCEGWNAKIVPFGANCQTRLPRISKFSRAFSMAYEKSAGFSAGFYPPPSPASDNASARNGTRGGDGKAGVEQEKRVGPGCAGAHPGDAARPGRAGRARRRPAYRRAPALSRGHGMRRGRRAPASHGDDGRARRTDRLRSGVAVRPMVPYADTGRRWSPHHPGSFCRRRWAACRALPDAGAGGGRHAGARRCKAVFPRRFSLCRVSGPQSASCGGAIHPLTGPSGHLSPCPGERSRGVGDNVSFCERAKGASVAIGAAAAIGARSRRPASLPCSPARSFR